MELEFPLPPEVEQGNIEYKLCLKLNETYKFDKLSAQMLWRLNEGKNINGVPEAYYYVGVFDNGNIGKEDIKSVNESISVLDKVSKLCNAEIESIDIKKVNENYIGIVKIKKFSDINLNNDIKVLVLGGYNHGKSTLISVLSYAELDDGNGSARFNVLHYSHEIGSGETSSINTEIIGFNNGNIINYSNKMINSWEDIVRKSKKVINLVDVPGKDKYYKTTYFGITSSMADYALIVVDITNMNEGINIIKKYRYICNKLSIPSTIILTKTDLVDDDSIKNIMNDYKFSIPISNKTGKNIDKLQELLNNIPSNISKKNYANNTSKKKQFMINKSSYVQDVGIVLSGIVLVGELKIGDKLLLGPFGHKFYGVTIKSIHIKQLPSKVIKKYQSGTLVIKIDSRLQSMKITKNMMLSSSHNIHNFLSKFYIKMSLNNPFNLSNGSTLLMFSDNIIEVIKINKIERYNDYLIITSELLNKNIIRYIQNNNKIILKNNDNMFIATIYQTKKLCFELIEEDADHE